jgi:hypothetical protein
MTLTKFGPLFADQFTNKTPTYCSSIWSRPLIATANHDLLFAIVEKHGAPWALIDVIWCLHDNFQLKLVFDKKNQAIIDYTVGVW